MEKTNVFLHIYVGLLTFVNLFVASKGTMISEDFPTLIRYITFFFLPVDLLMVLRGTAIYKRLYHNAYTHGVFESNVNPVVLS